LGEEQWEWLDLQLKDKNVQFFLIGTGSQFFPDDRFMPETWPD